jgi:hypothetical protein
MEGLYGKPPRSIEKGADGNGLLASLTFFEDLFSKVARASILTSFGGVDKLKESNLRR